MKSFMKSILYSVFVLLVLNACTKKETCPPDVVLGNVSLESNSKDFLPYNHITYLEFVDSAAIDTAILFNPAGLVSDLSKAIVGNICLLDAERSDSFYYAEHKTINFFDIDTSRKFRVIGNLTILEDYLSKSSTPDNPVLFDELKLTVHRSNPSLSGGVATLEFVTNDRGNKSRMSDSLISKISRFSLIPQVSVNGSVYNDVYEYRTNDSAYFYFKPLKGVVAFRDLSNRWWNLSRAY
jgi:hypothetical protein